MIKLPPWGTLLTNFPNKSAGEVFSEIGGKVKFNYDTGVFSNACATRISAALNGAGNAHLIPYFKTIDANGKEVVQVSSGAVNGSVKKWFIFRVSALSKYLREKYGAPKPIEVAKYRQDLNGKKGIIIFEVTGWSDATGHADLWDGKKCVNADYGDKANKILFWEAF